MPQSNPVKIELDDLKAKLSGAREAAARPDASERDKSDLKLIEQDYLAAKQKARRASHTDKPEGQPADPKKTLDKKLDAALKDSFPGSDPVSFVEAAPVKEQDRSLPAVKAAEQQAPEKTEAARKAK